MVSFANGGHTKTRKVNGSEAIRVDIGYLSPHFSSHSFLHAEVGCEQEPTCRSNFLELSK